MVHKQRKTFSFKFIMLLIVLTLLTMVVWLPSKPYKFANNLLPLLFPAGSFSFDDVEIEALKGTATFTNFKLKQHPNFGDATMLESPRMQVQFKPFQTIGENITLEYIHLDRPSLTILMAPDGSLNINYPASDSYASFLHIKELRAPELQLICIDQTADDTYTELIATNISLNAFNIKLTGKKPANNLIDEIIVEAPQMLFSRTGQRIRKKHLPHQLQVRKVKVRANLFTYEDNNMQPEMLDIGVSNLFAQVDNLIIGTPLATIVHPSQVDLTGQIVQRTSNAPLGIIGSIGPLVGRKTQVKMVTHAMGLNLDLLTPLYRGDRRKRLLAGAALGGNNFDLHIETQGRLSELKCRIDTESARGTRTDSTFILKDADYKNRVFFNNLAYFLSQPKTAGLPASASDVPVDVKVKTWHDQTPTRAAKRIERSRKERSQ